MCAAPRLGDLTAVGGLSSWGRLCGAAWILIRADALVPKEIESLLPGAPRAAARLLRLFAARSARERRPGERLAGALEQLGPAAIKLGQLLSTRADVFGPRFAEDLSRLKDRLPPFPDAAARLEVERAFGRPVADVFTEFGEAVAAASLAQVHRAKLADGRAVAVKVLRPGVERRISMDADALALAARLAQAWVPASRRLEPRAFAATVARMLSLELDLRFEAAGADELAAVMAADLYMTAPAVVWSGVSRRVLTLEWAPGAPLTKPHALEQPGMDRPRLADNLVRAFLAQALDHGAFHADLHEGNLFVQPPARLTAVDFGIVGRLGSSERRWLAEILWGFLRRDYRRVAAVHFEAGYVPPSQDPAAFAQALRAVGEPVFGRTARDVSMSRLLGQLFEITALFEMRLRPELVLLQKTMVTVEGVARRIDPDHDIWRAAEPVVRRWITRELSPAARVNAFAADARDALAVLARQGAQTPAPPPNPPEKSQPRAGTPWIAYAAGVLTASLAFVIAAFFR
jgi:ubiquinone biosynthesis protein